MVSINRLPGLGTHDFSHVFSGFKCVKAVRRIFGVGADRVLDNLTVCVSRKNWYMWVDTERKFLMVGRKYLMYGPKAHIFLDVIHELVHMRQLYEGMDLWDKRYNYVDRPTEIEAYKVAFKEAKRLGMSKADIKKYLKVEWAPAEDSERLYRHIGMKSLTR